MQIPGHLRGCSKSAVLKTVLPWNLLAVQLFQPLQIHGTLIHVPGMHLGSNAPKEGSHLSPPRNTCSCIEHQWFITCTRRDRIYGSSWIADRLDHVRDGLPSRMNFQFRRAARSRRFDRESLAASHAFATIIQGLSHGRTVHILLCPCGALIFLDKANAFCPCGRGQW